MAEDIVTAKAEAALKAAGGNKHDAQKLLITWAVRDPELLLSMVKPHLKAIATGWLDHLARGQGSQTEQGASTSGRTAIDDLVAAASTKAPLEKRKKSTLPPPKSTERQASTMRKLAEAFSKKDKDKA